MQLIALVLALSAPTADPTDAPVEPAPIEQPAPSSSSPPAPASPSAPASASPVAAWGVGLVAVGASVAAAGTVGFTLIEALSTPDRAGNPISEDAENFTQAAGFTAIALASVSAVVLVIGAGMILVDEEASSSSSSSSSSSPPSDPTY